MRMIRTGAPATVASLQPMNGSAASERSAPSQAAASRSRERGPATAAPAHWSVTDVRCTSRSGHTVCA